MVEGIPSVTKKSSPVLSERISRLIASRFLPHITFPRNFPSPKKALLVALTLVIGFSWALSSGDSRSASNDSHLIQQLLTEQRRLQEEIIALKGGNETSSPSHTAIEDFENSPITQKLLALDGSERDDPFLGPKDSPLLVMIFSDFQCKLCRDFHLQTLPRLRAEWADTNKAKIIYRDFPLVNNKHAREAARFASCAGEQGSYWKAFDVLKAHAEEIDLGKVDSLVRFLPQLNAQTMNECMRSVRYEREITLDLAQGQSLGAKGAPSVFVGKLSEDRFYHGVLIRGAQPYPVIAQELERFER